MPPRRRLHRLARGRACVLLLCSLGAGLLLRTHAASSPPIPVITVPHGPNAPAQQAKPYVVLVSLDGFRYDYAAKYGAPHLDSIAEHGVSAPEGMLPAFPSTTFPNHYTLVTGLYPEHHGIVGMSFYDPVRKQRYAFNDLATVADGSWYGGTPLWVLAEKQGMRTACFFWPGSEAEIDGQRPSYYLKFDDRIPEERRIEQVAAWLRLPAERRPHFITLYYGSVDHAGHSFGPDAPETRDAVRHADKLIGDLEGALKKLHLPIDLIVVSDHGMAAEEGGWINLDAYADLTGFETAGSLLYAPSESAAAKAYQQLKIVSDRFTVYRRSNVPAALWFSSNPRVGDPVIVANGPYAIRAHAPAQGTEDHPPNKGVHGYNPGTMLSMRAIFYAEGPGIRAGVRLRPFENVNVYPVVAAILGLNAPTMDGSLNVLSGILKTPPAEREQTY